MPVANFSAVVPVGMKLVHEGLASPCTSRRLLIAVLLIITYLELVAGLVRKVLVQAVLPSVVLVDVFVLLQPWRKNCAISASNQTSVKRSAHLVCCRISNRWD